MMKILQSTSSALVLLLASAAILTPQANAASTSSAASPAQSTPQAQPQLISQAGVLRQGDSNDAVATLQQQLTTLGYFSGAVTGFFGSFTEEAVIRFQRDAGLTADGIVGAGTQDEIQRRLTAAAPPAASGSLQEGSTGDQVTELQNRLTTLGYFNGPISGRFGPLTKDAVIRFQSANGLTADGVVGPGTSDALRRASAPVPVTPPVSTTTLRRGDTGQRVVDLQSRLRALGFYNGSINGSYGSLTESAVIAFQQSRGLTADGIAGPEVLSILERVSPNSAAPSSNTESTASNASEQPIRESERRASLTDGDRYSVAELQRRLQSQGHNPGEVNGVLNPETRQAITAAQQEHGLSQSDIPRQ
jgi:peptidoglycan hydrolase-like protein with peptidoglycan-binding domain